MFGKLFGRRKQKPADAPDSLRPDESLYTLQNSSRAQRAAELLIAPSALMQLSPQEALTVVNYMEPRCIDEGVTFINEGDKHDTGYMVLLLEGEVTIENIVVSRRTPVTVTVLGPGSLVGEIGLVDGQPRLASCTASTDVRCAILSRTALEQLCLNEPATGAKLMLAVSVRIAERLRNTTEKLKMYSQLVQTMQQEAVDASHPEMLSAFSRLEAAHAASL